jgi:sialate O-acetylesterase
MKLQPALIFGEHMVLKRREPILVWGRSARGDSVTVTLDGQSATSVAEGGIWSVTLPAHEAATGLKMTILSAKTGEKIEFNDVAVGEVWLAGGQSNMEFYLKYDEGAEEMYTSPADSNFRFFRYPTAQFAGCLDKDPYPDDGFWRTWASKDDRGMFSAVSAYMGLALREALNVPVGFIGVNWGGTPASAWTALEDIEENPALAPILKSYEESVSGLDLRKYYIASEKPQGEPTPEAQESMDKFMMGMSLEEIFKSSAPPPPEDPDYSPYMMGPHGAVRPAGLYDFMLKAVAPYAVSGIIWYQGEDDDFRGWQSFYDESMKTLIKSWRKLWNKELPFLQVELAPFRGRGETGAKEYYTMRTKQRAASDALDGVYNICIMDSGDEYNIHVRKKKPVGERLALLARKYVYGENDILADSPRLTGALRDGDTVRLTFSDAGEGLYISGDIMSVLSVTVGDKPVSVTAKAALNELILYSDEFAGNDKITIKFCELNYCEDPLFNSAGLPAFPFTVEV